MAYTTTFLNNIKNQKGGAININKYESYKCSNFNPSSTNKQNKNKYAYVMLLMINESYLSGALVCAYCLKKQNTLYDLVIMVTPDISLKTREILKKIYDKVVEVEYLIPQYGKVKSNLVEKYPQYVKTFTKINLFKLTEYDKILYLDIDSIPFKYFDTLFELNTPACVYYGESYFFKRGIEKAFPHMVENNWNPRLKGDTYIWHKKYCKCCGHGKQIPAEKTDEKTNRHKFGFVGISAELMLHKPDLETYNSMLKIIRESNDEKYFKGSDASLFGEYYSGQWIGIDPIFLGFSGYPHPLMLYGIQIGGSLKPWTDIALGLRQNNKEKNYIFNDMWSWYYFYYKMIKQYKYFLNYPSLLLLYRKVKRVLKKIKKDKELMENILLFDSYVLS